MKAFYILAIVSFPLVFSSCASHKLRTEAEQAALITSISTYKQKIGKYPQGTNEEILTELQGKRPGSVVFIEWPARSIDPSGNFLDPWGKAYVFEFPSKNTALIRSAGRDRIYLTPDDITRREE